MFEIAILYYNQCTLYQRIVCIDFFNDWTKLAIIVFLAIVKSLAMAISSWLSFATRPIQRTTAVIASLIVQVEEIVKYKLLPWKSIVLRIG